MEHIFDALADKTRRAILDRLYVTEGLSLSQICEELSMTRPGVAKHLLKLERANLVVVVRKGREKLHYLNVVPLHEIYVRWMRKFDKPRAQALWDLRTGLEQDS